MKSNAPLVVGICVVLMLILGFALVKVMDLAEREREAQRVQREYEEAMARYRQELARYEDEKIHFDDEWGDYQTKVIVRVHGLEKSAELENNTLQIAWLIKHKRTALKTKIELGAKIRAMNSGTLVLRFFSSEPEDWLHDQGAKEIKLGKVVGSEQAPYISDLVNLNSILDPDGNPKFAYFALVIKMNEQRDQATGESVTRTYGVYGKVAPLPDPNKWNLRTVGVAEGAALSINFDEPTSLEVPGRAYFPKPIPPVKPTPPVKPGSG